MNEIPAERFGCWKSPIGGDDVGATAIFLDAPRLESKKLYWTEARPEDDGRTVLVVREQDGSTRDVTHNSYDIRSRVHEYGGGAYVVEGDNVYFLPLRLKQGRLLGS